MAISYQKFVNVTSAFADAGATAVDLTGLVILPKNAQMENDAPSATKIAFDEYKMVTLSATSYADCFAAPSYTYGDYTTSDKVSGQTPQIAWDDTNKKWKATVTISTVTYTVYGSNDRYSVSESVIFVVADVATTVEFTRTRTLVDPSKGFYDFAQKHFAYCSPSVSVATAIKVMKMKPSTAPGQTQDETPDEAFKRAINDGTSFGSFAFVGTVDPVLLKTVAKSNMERNNEYRFILGVSHGSTTADNYYEKYGTGTGTTFTPWTYSGLTMTECPYLSMAILAATNYDGTNTTTTHEFKTLDGETATVVNDSDKELLDGYNISYYGMTKANGATKSFYQEGFNADGTDTACYDNEMWMKRKIVSNLLALETTVEKIPPTPTGVAMVINVVTTVANQGLKNGSILPEKPIAESQKALVIQLCGGDRDAPFKLNQYGYILAADIVMYVEGGKQKYKIVYKLVYLKGDAVRYIEGTHNVI